MFFGRGGGIGWRCYMYDDVYIDGHVLLKPNGGLWLILLSTALIAGLPTPFSQPTFLEKKAQFRCDTPRCLSCCSANSRIALRRN